MVSILGLIVLLFWIPQVFYQVLVWLYWWQVKEYRADRFFVFIKTKEGSRKIGLHYSVMKLVVLSLSLINSTAIYLLAAMFLFLDFLIIKSLFNRKINKPAFTQRAKKILLITVVFILLTIVLCLFSSDFVGFLIFGELVIIPSFCLGIFWTGRISEKVKKEEILEAKAILERVKPVVIGITGSYGKTTTKDFTAHLLSQKYKVAKTTGNQNTEFGVARNIREFVKPGIEFFVVELGAYKRGEIKRLASIVSPDVGVVTGIEEQHFSLFGNLENIKKTKFEIIESLPKGGIGLFNLSNSYCRELADWAKNLPTKLIVRGYATETKKSFNAYLYSKVVYADSQKIIFETYLGRDKKELTVFLPGVHFIENLSCAILIARLFDVSWKLIEKGCSTLTLPDNTMKVFKLKSGAVVIDDTHNSTPKAFESALSYLFLFKGKKIVITSGIIELGEKSDYFHTKFGRKMKGIVDKIFLTNSDFLTALENGMGEESDKVILDPDVKILRSEVKSILGGKNTVLLEGRVPSFISDLINQKR